MNLNKILITTAVVFACVASRAGLTSQVDTNSLAPLTTNTFILSGDVTGTYTTGEAPGQGAILKANTAGNAYLEVGGFFTNSTTGASNINYLVAASYDGNLWSNTMTLTVIVTPKITNWVFTTTNIPSTLGQSAPLYGIWQIQNTNSAVIYGAPNSQFIKCYMKDGI